MKNLLISGNNACSSRLSEMARSLTLQNILWPQINPYIGCYFYVIPRPIILIKHNPHNIKNRLNTPLPFKNKCWPEELRAHVTISTGNDSRCNPPPASISVRTPAVTESVVTSHQEPTAGTEDVQVYSAFRLPRLGPNWWVVFWKRSSVKFKFNFD